MKKIVILPVLAAGLILALAACESPVDDNGTANGSNQTPIAADYEIGNRTQIAGNVIAVTIAAKGGKSPGAVSNIRYANNAAIPQTAGTYALTFDVSAAAGWNAASGLNAGTLTVNAAISNQIPVAGDYDVSGHSQIFDGSFKALHVTHKSGKSSGGITIYYEGSGTTNYPRNTTPPSAAGTYAVTFDVAAVTGWSAASGLNAGTLTIAAQVENPGDPEAGDFTVSGLTQVYDGSPRELSVTRKAGKSEGIITIYYEGTDYPKSENAPTATGTYAITFDVAEALGWNAASGLIAGMLLVNTSSENQTPVAVDFTITGTGTFAYDGGVKTVTVAANSSKTMGAVTVLYNGNAAAPSAVGTYAVTFNVAAATGFNAATGLIAGTLTITNQTPTAADYDVSGHSQIFDGNPKAVHITRKSDKSAGAITIYYEGTENTNYTKNTAAPSAVGTYAVTFNVVATIGWNVAMGLSAGTLTITKQTPVDGDFTITGTGTFAYDGGVKTVTVTANSGKTMGTVSVLYNGSADAPSDVGTYTVTFNVTEAVGFNAVNGLNAGTMIINKAAGAVVDVPTLNIKTHNGITVNPVSMLNGQIVEYAISADTTVPTNGWQSSSTFTGLNAGTNYYIFARAVGNSNYEMGAVSGNLAVVTPETVSAGRIEYYWVDQHGSLVTTSGNTVTVITGTTLTLTAQSAGYDVKQWRLNGSDTGQNGNMYNFSNTRVGTHTISLLVEKDGKLYNTNIAITVVQRTVTIDMYDSNHDGWDHNGALRISINGTDIPNVTLANNSFGTYKFSVLPGDVVNIYWTGSTGTYHRENAFIVYYTDTPPSRPFDPTSNVWSGSNALVLRQYSSLSNTNLNQLLGSFMVP